MITVEDEDRWVTIRDNALLRKRFDYLSPTVKMNREKRPEMLPLRMVFHMD